MQETKITRTRNKSKFTTIFSWARSLTFNASLSKDIKFAINLFIKFSDRSVVKQWAPSLQSRTNSLQAQTRCSICMRTVCVELHGRVCVAEQRPQSWLRLIPGVKHTVIWLNWKLNGNAGFVITMSMDIVIVAGRIRAYPVPRMTQGNCCIFLMSLLRDKWQSAIAWPKHLPKLSSRAESHIVFSFL